MKCPECGSKRIFKDGFRLAPISATSETPIQRYRCAEYSHRFSKHLNSKINKMRDNQICANLGAKNLVSTQEIKTCAELDKTPTENEINAIPQIEKYLQDLKNNGRKNCTINNHRKALRILLRAGADLFDPESVKSTLAKLQIKGSSKKTLTAILCVWFDFNSICWKAPKYIDTSESPYIPTEAELDQFIACLGKKTGAFCQLLKDTGARCGEIAVIKWTDIDFGQRKIRIKAEKGSNSRTLTLSPKTLDMLCNLPRKTERIFSNNMSSSFGFQRKRKAIQLSNPHFNLIHFHTFRHWKATTEQHKTHDPWHVKMILGHKSIQSTEQYIHLEKMLYDGNNSDQFTVKVADTLEDAVKLIEVGFEFHTEIEGHKIFRKRK